MNDEPVVTQYQRLCTVHQRVNSTGHPLVLGSEVRTPMGEAIPHVQSVHIEAIPGDGLWKTTITVLCRFGEAIGPDEPVR